MSASLNRSLTIFVLATAMMVCKSGMAAEILWCTDIDDALHRAAASGQPVLMEFTAEWCVFCKKMEKSTFTNTDVAARISQDFVAVRVDADQNKDLVKELGIKGLPAILIVTPELKVIERISGFQTPEALIPKLETVTASHSPRGRAAKTVSAQNSPQRPMTAAPRPELFEPEAIKPSRLTRKEQELETHTQPDSPREARRTEGDSAANRFVDVRSVASLKPSEFRVAASDSDPDSFFKTISGEQEHPAVAEEKSAPAFDGLCLVSAVHGRELVKGTARSQVNYRGQTLYFSSSENKARFLASPATYWPMLDGACAMTLLEDEQRVAGSLEFAAVFRKHIWLFASQEAMQEFLRDPADIASTTTELTAELQR